MSYDVFKDLCRKKGVTPSEVSRATGVATSTLTEWKKGRYVPKADKLAKIAEYFGVTVEYLMTGEEPEGYYINPEAAEMAQEIFENRILGAGRVVCPAEWDEGAHVVLSHLLLGPLRAPDRGGRCPPG